MATFILTVIGDDRPGLVSALSAPINAHGASWERSQMSRLAGKFAGIVLVAVADERLEALAADLMALEVLWAAAGTPNRPSATSNVQRVLLRGMRDPPSAVVGLHPKEAGAPSSGAVACRTAGCRRCARRRKRRRGAR